MNDHQLAFPPTDGDPSQPHGIELSLQDDEIDCNICFLEYDEERSRMSQPCCRQFLCTRCDGFCHGKGQPCAFCRQVVRPPKPLGQAKAKSRRRRRR